MHMLATCGGFKVERVISPLIADLVRMPISEVKEEIEAEARRLLFKALAPEDR